MRKNKQLLTYLSVLVFVILLNFWLPRFLPGGPIDYLTGGEDGAVYMSEAQKEAMLAYYHLDATLMEQFTMYLTGIFALDFGLSITHKAPVFEVIFLHLSWTLLIVGLATLLSIIIGLALGLVSAWKYPGKTDHNLFVTMLGISAIPEFLIGMILLILFAVHWNILPLSGAETPFFRPAYWWERAVDIGKHLLLPVLTLTLGNLAGLYLLMRNEALRVRQEPFIEVAQARGVRDRDVLVRHVARNAALPLVTMIMIRTGGLLAGSVLVETVFSYPGVGKLMQEAILARDYPLLHGLFLLMTVFVLLLNMAADLIYPRLDPRIRLNRQEEWG